MPLPKTTSSPAWNARPKAMAAAAGKRDPPEREPRDGNPGLSRGHPEPGKGRIIPLKRIDNILLVVDDLEAVKAFFIELGLTLEGEQTVEGPAVGQLIGLGENVRATLAMLRTPDGQGIELDKFHT